MMDEAFLREAIGVAEASVASGGGPFGALVVVNGEVVGRGSNRVTGEVVGRGSNRVTGDNDPTAHAEVVAIRAACMALGDFRLAGATLYVSCEPCPMCFAAAYWARIGRIVFAASREDAAAAGFDDVVLHEQVSRPVAARALPMEQLLRDESLQAFSLWRDYEGRVDY